MHLSRPSKVKSLVFSISYFTDRSLALFIHGIFRQERAGSRLPFSGFSESPGMHRPRIAGRRLIRLTTEASSGSEAKEFARSVGDEVDSLGRGGSLRHWQFISISSKTDGQMSSAGLYLGSQIEASCTLIHGKGFENL